MIFDSAARRTYLIQKYCRKAEENKSYYNQALNLIYTVGCHLPFEYLSFYYQSICFATYILKSASLVYQANKYTELHNIVKPKNCFEGVRDLLLREEISSRYQVISQGINTCLLGFFTTAATITPANITAYFALRLSVTALANICDTAERIYRTGSYTHHKALSGAVTL